LGKRELTGGPGLSAGERERGKGGGGGWAGPRRRWGARGGLLGLQAEKRKGKGGKGFSFFLHIFQMNFFSSNIFLEQDILVFKTIITKEMLQHECNINISLSLY